MNHPQTLFLAACGDTHTAFIRFVNLSSDTLTRSRVKEILTALRAATGKLEQVDTLLRDLEQP